MCELSVTPGGFIAQQIGHQVVTVQQYACISSADTRHNQLITRKLLSV